MPSVPHKPYLPCVLQAYMELNFLMKDQDQQGYLQGNGRWVGNEENYDPEAGGWGPSHISYLTFKSLILLQKTMSTGEKVNTGEINFTGEIVSTGNISSTEVRQ